MKTGWIGEPCRGWVHHRSVDGSPRPAGFAEPSGRIQHLVIRLARTRIEARSGQHLNRTRNRTNLRQTMKEANQKEQNHVPNVT